MPNIAETDPLLIGTSPVTVDTDGITTPCYIIRNFKFKDASSYAEDTDDKGNVKLVTVSGRIIEASAMFIVKNSGTCRVASKGDTLAITHPLLNGGSALDWVVSDEGDPEDAGVTGVRQNVTLRYYPELDTSTVANGNPAQAPA